MTENEQQNEGIDVRVVLDAMHAEYGQTIADLTEKLTMKSVSLRQLQDAAQRNENAMREEIIRLHSEIELLKSGHDVEVEVTEEAPDA